MTATGRLARIRFSRMLVLFLAAAVVLVGLAEVVLIASEEGALAHKDYSQEYLLGRAIRDRVDPYQPIHVLAERYVPVRGFFEKIEPTPHPPTVGLIALPFSLLSYQEAVHAWLAFELLCLLATVFLLGRAAGFQIPLYVLPLVALALVAWPPMTLELSLGQLMLPLLTALAAAQLALIKKRMALAGVLLAISLLIKPIAWPWLLFLVWRRYWLALLATGCTVLVAVGFAVLTVGADAAWNYATQVLPAVSTQFQRELTNMSLWTVAPRTGLSIPPWVVPLVALAITVAVARRRRTGDALGLVTTASLLVSPITWYFYLVLALLPLTRALAAVERRGRRGVEIGALLVVFALLSWSQFDLVNAYNAGFATGVLLEPAAALGLLGVLVAILGVWPCARNRSTVCGTTSAYSASSSATYCANKADPSSSKTLST